MADAAKATALKVAENESAFRDANERVRRAAVSYGFEPDQGVPFLCECSDPGCRAIVMLSLEEYEAVRTDSKWFLMLPGHEDSEATNERIVADEEGYCIIEKTGRAGEEAARLDEPRASRLHNQQFLE